MNLTDYLTQETIKIPLSASDKEGVIAELVEVVAAAKPVADKGTLLEAIKDREKMGSTGVGNGIAIPHGKTDAVKELVIALGSTPVGVDFEAVDGEPVRLFFLLAGPKDASSLQIKALAQISRLSRNNDVMEALLSAKDSSEALDILRNA